MSKKKMKVKQQRRPRIEELEPRILYSADFAPALADAFAPRAEQRTLDTSGEFTQPAAQVGQSRTHEIVFVDPATPDYQKLVEDIRAKAGDGRDIDVVLLDANKDGITQITETLAKRSKAAAQMSGKKWEDVHADRMKVIPAGRFGTPEEFGALCAFICSAHASYITGQNFLIDGGVYPGTF